MRAHMFQQFKRTYIPLYPRPRGHWGIKKMSQDSSNAS